MKHLLLAASLALASLAPCAQEAPASWAVSAHDAAAAIARGASVLDIRPPADYLAGHLPRSVSAAPAREMGEGREQLQALVSVRGIDLSREVVIVGEPGDAAAQRLVASLSGYATGRVVWLVGGVHEWALSGRPLDRHVVSLPPVPQYLVALNAAETAQPRMAGAALRDVRNASAARIAFN